MDARERMEYFKLGNTFTDPAHSQYLSEHKPNYLYQYRSGSEQDYKNLFNQQIWFSFPLYLNDPFEYEYGTYSDGVLISCFSERCDSLLMWSHYANGHSGYCVKYKYDDICKYFNYNLFPVIYSNERFKPTIKESGNSGEIISTFMHKSCEWKYEKEWRLIKLISITDRKFPKRYARKGEIVEMPKPTEIIMGCHYNDYNSRLKLAKYCKENNIALYSMHMKDSKYRLFKIKQQFKWYEPPDDNMEEYVREYLKTDAAKRDLKKMKEGEKEYRKTFKEQMKYFL